MITVSDRAKGVLWQSLRESGQPALRLQPKAERYTLDVDLPTKDDRVIRYRDEPVLIIDGELDEVDLLIDVTDGPQGAQLTIRSIPASAADT